jgi:glycosyltransferase involved in cell wall biosynthesis
MLTPYLPYPPSSGGHIRSFNLIKNLSRHHEIVLVTLIKNEEELKYTQFLKKYCKEVYTCKRSKSPWTLSNIARSVLGPDPLLIIRNFSPEAKKTIQKLLTEQKFDLIHAETFYIMPHIPKTKIPILLVEQTIEYLVYEKFVKNLNFIFKPLYLEVLKLKHWEKIYWKKADLVATVSESDKDKILSIQPDLKVVVIPNAAGEDLMSIFQEKKIIKKPIFLFQGNFFWLQNVEAAEILAKDLFPKIKEKIPDAICYIAGQKAQDKIGYLSKYGVKIIDINSDDITKVRNVYREATIFIAPIEGPGGTRLKILGAMAAGVPVISSTVGVTGLSVEDKMNVLIANTPEEYINKAIMILHDKNLYNRIRDNARGLIDSNYNWEKITERLESVYQKLKDHKYENSN